MSLFLRATNWFVYYSNTNEYNIGAKLRLQFINSIHYTLIKIVPKQAVLMLPLVQ